MKIYLKSKPFHRNLVFSASSVAVSQSPIQTRPPGVSSLQQRLGWKLRELHSHPEDDQTGGNLSADSSFRKRNPKVLRREWRRLENSGRPSRCCSVVEPSVGVCRRVLQLVPGLFHHKTVQTLQVPGTCVLVAADAGSVDDEGGVAVDLGTARRKMFKLINIRQDTLISIILISIN